MYSLYHFAVGDAGFCCINVTIFIIVCSDEYILDQLAKHKTGTVPSFTYIFLISPPQRLIYFFYPKLKFFRMTYTELIPR